MARTTAHVGSQTIRRASGAFLDGRAHRELFAAARVQRERALEISALGAGAHELEAQSEVVRLFRVMPLETLEERIPRPRERRDQPARRETLRRASLGHALQARDRAIDRARGGEGIASRR